MPFHKETCLFMKKKFTAILTLCLLIFASLIMAQETEIENLIENEDEFSDAHNLFEILSELEENPLNLNKANIEQLSLLPWISDILAIKIIEYKKQNKKFNSLEELTNIPEFDESLLPLISKYVSVSPPGIGRDLSINIKTRTSQKLEQSQGIKDGIYYPSPVKAYNRLICDYGKNIRLGMILEKDSGENRLNDFSSYFLKYQNPHNGNSVILGHYFLEFAQGLIFWNPYSSYKSSNPIYSAKKRARGATEYKLVDENNSLLGISGKICAKFYQMTFFYSSKKLDANIDEKTNTVSSIYSAGYHRTTSEEAKRDQLIEELYGSRIVLLPNSKFTLGLTGYTSQFDHAIYHDDVTRYRFDFQGKDNSVYGFDFNFNHGLFNIFGEFAQSQNKGFGLLSGIVLDSKNFDFSVLFRNYSKYFNSLHGNGFGEHGYQPQNEKGVYFGFNYRLSSNLKTALYFDHYKFPWRTYLIPTPSQGNDWLALIHYKPIKKLWLYWHIKSSNKTNALTGEETYSLSRHVLIPRKQFNLRFQIDYKFSKQEIGLSEWHLRKKQGILRYLTLCFITSTFLEYYRLMGCFGRHFGKDTLLNTKGKEVRAYRHLMFERFLIWVYEQCSRGRKIQDLLWQFREENSRNHEVIQFTCQSTRLLLMSESA